MYIDDMFEFDGELFGRLRSHSSPKFFLFVRVTSITPKYTNWMSVDPDIEKKARLLYERTIKKKKK